MRVLILGSGGREHALARALARDPDVTALHAAPGNPGIAEIAETHAVTATDPGQVDRAGRPDSGPTWWSSAPRPRWWPAWRTRSGRPGVACFGPGQAARDDRGLEVVRQAGHDRGQDPHRGGQDLRQPRARSAAALDEFGPPYVVKADGLAGGQGRGGHRRPGAALPSTRAPAGRVVIEEFLDGPEVSLFALADGGPRCRCCPRRTTSAPATGTAGPNTGGMGAYAPLPWAPAGAGRATSWTR